MCVFIINFIATRMHPQRGFAEVKWAESQHSTIHKVGAEGKVHIHAHDNNVFSGDICILNFVHVSQ